MLGQIRAWVRVPVLFFCTCIPALGQGVGTLTAAEGRVELVRGTTTYAVAPGVKLQNGDMLATDPKGQAQIEFDDGTLLNLSRGSRAFLLGAQSGEESVALQSGWAKFARVKTAKASPYRYLTPLARIGSAAAIGVLRVGEESCEMFVESGSARLVELSKSGAPGTGRDVKGGEFAVRRAGQPLTVSSRPSADFLKAMPGYFRDDLPVLISRVKGRSAEPAREHEATYAEVEAWLKASAPIRRNLVARFENRAKDGEFRKKLVENLKEHPEWDRILFPEKYEKDSEKSEKSQKEKGQ
jgi:hypothetical protein